MTDKPLAEHTISTMEALMAQGAAIVELQDEIAALKAERDKWQLLADCRQRLIEKQRAALEWYANKKHWPMKFDNGEMARRALEERS